MTHVVTNTLPVNETLDDALRRLSACRDAIRWAEPYGLDWSRAWAECPRGDWMLWVAAIAGCDRALVVRAASACARRALSYIPSNEDRPRLALDTADAWCLGEASLSQVMRAARAACAEEAADLDADAAVAAVAAAAYAAVAADATEAAEEVYAAVANAAAAYAGSVPSDAATADRARSLAHSAAIVRHVLPYAAIRAVIIRAEVGA